MFDNIDDLWSWLFDTPAEVPAVPETIGNYDSIPETHSPQHHHLDVFPVMMNKRSV